MDKTPAKYKVFCIYIALAIATIGAFESVRHNDFIDLDDNLYVAENPNIKDGLTYQAIRWAFTKTYAAFWHPLTMVSYIIDYQLFGLNPAGYHITSLLLHIANTLLLFGVLKNMTGGTWQSAFVAAAFALHPLHVESVAWVAERKDVLSTLFWLLTMAAYLRYVKHPGIYSYMLMLLIFTLGLMAKPMLVTLPFVLLLLDYWPLGRFKPPYFSRAGRKLILEKIPLLILSLLWCAATFLSQKKIGALPDTTLVPMSIRIANALMVYLVYLEKTIWPTRMAVLYPYLTDALSPPYVTVYVLLLSGISAAVIRLSSRFKYLLTGWLWYLGTLVPVIGLIQVGSHSMADRYTYVPLTGIFIIAAWAAADVTAKWRYQKTVLTTASVIILAALFVCSRTQLKYWRNSIALFDHALKVTGDNSVMQYCLACSLKQQNRLDEAINHYRQTLLINPAYYSANYNLGVILQSQGKLDEAIYHYKETIRKKPDYAEAHNNLGILLKRKGRLDDAQAHFRQAVKLKPDFTEAYNNLGYVLRLQGKLNEAITYLRKALSLKADHPATLDSLALILISHPDPNVRNVTEAVELAERAAGLTNHHSAGILNTLSTAYAAAGRFEDAIATAQEALTLASADKNEELVNHLRRQLDIYASHKSR